jgi:outer membrane scaffolding protein for murein synthesis (MipA/OmpV family)
MSRTTLLALLLAPLLLTAAQAQPAAPNPTLLGAGVWSRPAYDGADAQATTLIPNVRYYGPIAFARTTMGLLEGGARWDVTEGLVVGAQAAYEGGRKSSESAFLAARQLPDLPASLSWGLHAELERNIGPVPLDVLLRYRQDMDGERGAQLDLRLTAGVYSGGGLKAGVFVQGTWADAKASQYYYGITPALAVSSGLPAHAPAGGHLFSAAGLLWSYELVPQQWLLLGSLEARRLGAAALDSPLVQTQASRYASLSLVRQF